MFFKEKRRETKRLVVRKHSKFVNHYLDPSQPSKKLFENLRKLGYVKSKSHQKCNVEAGELSNHFVVTPSDNRELDFDIPIAAETPKFPLKQ
jgi:transcriptional accessory protein Tex/SPT6